MTEMVVFKLQSDSVKKVENWF